MTRLSLHLNRYSSCSTIEAVKGFTYSRPYFEPSWRVNITRKIRKERERTVKTDWQSGLKTQEISLSAVAIKQQEQTSRSSPPVILNHSGKDRKNLGILLLPLSLWQILIALGMSLIGTCFLTLPPAPSLGVNYTKNEINFFRHSSVTSSIKNVKDAINLGYKSRK